MLSEATYVASDLDLVGGQGGRAGHEQHDNTTVQNDMAVKERRDDSVELLRHKPQRSESLHWGFSSQ